MVKLNIVNELEKGKWELVKDGRGKLWLVKSGVREVSIKNVESTSSGLTTDGIIYVIKEGIFGKTTALSKYTLKNITLEELVYKVIDNEDEEDGVGLVSDLLQGSTWLRMVSNFTELRGLVYQEKLGDKDSRDIKITGVRIF